MGKLSAVFDFIETRRKILASLFFFLAIFFAVLDGIILVQRPQTYQSKASEQKSPSSFAEFISPKGGLRLTYDQKQWSVWGSTFNLIRVSHFLSS